MLTELAIASRLVVASFLHLAPFLLLTIPLAVVVQLSGASRFLERALSARPGRAILLATLAGAFSPFCSCGVIPVVASLLIGGVPLPPVMAFWIASPSMDPEIFLLSVGTLGWELACWRLGGTLLLSLAAGYLTEALLVRGWLGGEFLRRTRPAGWRVRLRSVAFRLCGWIVPRLPLAPAMACCAVPSGASAPPLAVASAAGAGAGSPCRAPRCSEAAAAEPAAEAAGFWSRLLPETLAASWLVTRFMALAIVLEVVMSRYLPGGWIAGVLGAEQPLAIPLAAAIGIPLYTTNLTALALVGGLLGQGMSAGAALTFLVAGATTTLPAMAAVWGLVRTKVFVLYLSLVLGGSVVLGATLDILHRIGLG